jgi:hypothetical protein
MWSLGEPLMPTLILKCHSCEYAQKTEWGYLCQLARVYFVMAVGESIECKTFETRKINMDINCTTCNYGSQSVDGYLQCKLGYAESYQDYEEAEELDRSCDEYRPKKEDDD